MHKNSFTFQIMPQNMPTFLFKVPYKCMIPILFVVLIPLSSYAQSAKQLRSLFEREVFKDGIIISENNKMINDSRYYSAKVKFKYRSSSTFISQVNNFVDSYSDLSYLRTFRKRKNGNGIHADIVTDTNKEGGYYIMGINFVEGESESIGQVYVGYNPKK